MAYSRSRSASARLRRSSASTAKAWRCKANWGRGGADSAVGPKKREESAMSCWGWGWGRDRFTLFNLRDSEFYFQNLKITWCSLAKSHEKILSSNPIETKNTNSTEIPMTWPHKFIYTYVQTRSPTYSYPITSPQKTRCFFIFFFVSRAIHINSSHDPESLPTDSSRLIQNHHIKSCQNHHENDHEIRS